MGHQVGVALPGGQVVAPGQQVRRLGIVPPPQAKLPCENGIEGAAVQPQQLLPDALLLVLLPVLQPQDQIEGVLPPVHDGGELLQLRRQGLAEAQQQQDVQQIGGAEAPLPVLLQPGPGPLKGVQALPARQQLPVGRLHRLLRPGQKGRVRLVVHPQPPQQRQEDVLPRLHLALLDLAEIAHGAHAPAQALLAEIPPQPLPPDQRPQKLPHRPASLSCFFQYSGDKMPRSRKIFLRRRRPAGPEWA